MLDDVEGRLRHELIATGSEDDFWNKVADAGTPRIEETPDGIVLTLLYRQADGAAPSRVYVDAGPLTDHHAPQLHTMRRLSGTGIWFWATAVSRTWRGTYRFMPVSRAIVDALDPPGIGDSIAGVRSRFLGLLEHAVADEFNPHALDRASLADMPDAPTQRWWNGSGPQETVHPREMDWASQRLGTERTVWIHETGDAPDRPLIVVLDGRRWIEQAPLAPVLDRAAAAGALPAAVVLFVDSLDNETRSRELPCNEEFWRSVVDELLPLAATHAAFTSDPRRTVVAGQSFGGLAALFAGVMFPERFGLISSQSGSFWWPVMSHGGRMGPPGGRMAEILQNTAVSPQMTVTLAVGSREGDMSAHNHLIADLLREREVEVSFREFDGGHEWVCWRSELTESLVELLAWAPGTREDRGPSATAGRTHDIH